MTIDSYSEFFLLLLSIGIAWVAYFVGVRKLINAWMKRKFKK